MRVANMFKALSVLTRSIPQMRALVVRRKKARHLAKLHAAATTVQAVLRGHFARESIRRQLRAALRLQAWARGFLVRKTCSQRVRFLYW